jgi:hypothetical protein
MSKKKQQTQQTQNTNFQNTNSYGWLNAPETDDIKAVRDFKFAADPHIGYSFGNARNQLASSFANPLGGVYSPNMRDSILRSGNADLSQREAQAYSEANQGLQGQQFAQKGLVAGLTAPRMVQTGSSGSGASSGNSTTTQSGGLLGDLLLASMSGAGQGMSAAA